MLSVILPHSELSVSHLTKSSVMCSSRHRVTSATKTPALNPHALHRVDMNKKSQILPRQLFLLDTRLYLNQAKTVSTQDDSPIHHGDDQLHACCFVSLADGQFGQSCHAFRTCLPHLPCLLPCHATHTLPRILPHGGKGRIWTLGTRRAYSLSSPSAWMCGLSKDKKYEYRFCHSISDGTRPVRYPAMNGLNEGTAHSHSTRLPYEPQIGCTYARASCSRSTRPQAGRPRQSQRVL